MKHKDSLGSRCFLSNDSLTGEEVSRALWFLPAVCIRPRGSTNPPRWALQVRPLGQEFPLQPVEGAGGCCSLHPCIRFRKRGAGGKKGTPGAVVHEEGFKAAEADKV